MRKPHPFEAGGPSEIPRDWEGKKENIANWGGKEIEGPKNGGSHSNF